MRTEQRKQLFVKACPQDRIVQLMDGVDLGDSLRHTSRFTHCASRLFLSLDKVSGLAQMGVDGQDKRPGILQRFPGDLLGE